MKGEFISVFNILTEKYGLAAKKGFCSWFKCSGQVIHDCNVRKKFFPVSLYNCIAELVVTKFEVRFSMWRKKHYFWQFDFDITHTEQSLFEFSCNDLNCKPNTTMCFKVAMDRSDFTYPAVNLGIYAPNFTGKCGISFYEQDEADDKLRVFIVDIDQ